MKILKVFLFIIISVSAFAQGSAGTGAKLENQYIIDMPTAGVMKKGNVGTSFYLMPDGVLLTQLDVGVFDSFSFGISYGASNFIGVGAPSWYKLPGINIKAKIIDESETTPAVTLGFDSQGKGSYYSYFNDFHFSDSNHTEINRFKIKSPGFYVAASKNFQLLGYLSIHGCLNYSLEKDDGDRELNLRVGAEKTLGAKLSLVAEFDFAMNDNAKNSLGDGSGYLNAGIRWSIGEGFTIGFDLRDLLSNKKLNPGSADRAVKVEFVKPIF